MNAGGRVPVMETDAVMQERRIVEEIRGLFPCRPTSRRVRPSRDPNESCHSRPCEASELIESDCDAIAMVR